MYARWTAFCAELDVASNELLNFCATRTYPQSSSSLSLADHFYLEGFISFTWQSWCNFCRDCILLSCRGCVSGSGTAITPHPLAISEILVSGAAIRAKRNSLPYWGTPNSILRMEPTWGDVDVLTTIVPRLAPSNSSQLLAAISSGYSPIKALQIIRNATAHRNNETLASVLGLTSQYVTFPITDPVQAIFWTDPSTQDYLAIRIIDEMRDTAQNCIL